MFKWIHLVDAIASIVRKICSAVCDAFKCPDHNKGDK